MLAPHAGGVAGHPSAMRSLLGSKEKVLGILKLAVGELCFGRSAGCHVLCDCCDRSSISVAAMFQICSVRKPCTDTVLFWRYATGAPEHDENADGSNTHSSWFQRRMITRRIRSSYVPLRGSVLYDHDLDAY